MATFCTNTVSPNNCGHRIVSYTLDGEAFTFEFSEYEAVIPLSQDEKVALIKLGTRLLRGKGTTVANLLYRVVVGDEATNVKLYDIIGAGAAITKTNIGSTYVDVLPGLNAQCMLVDFTGCLEMRIRLGVNVVGTGPVAARLVRDGDSAVIFEATNVGAPGERDADTDWIPIPNGFTGQTLVRIQAKSAVAADDPVFRRCSVGVR